MATQFRAGAFLALLAACRIEPSASFEPAEDAVASGSNPPPETTSGGSSAGGRGSGASSGVGGQQTSVGAGGSAVPHGGSAGAAVSSGDASSSGDGGEASGGGSTGDEPKVYCDAQAVSFDEIRDGGIRLGAEVSIEATATSQKFLVSHASSGSCLFGAYVGVEPVGGEPRGLLVVSYGEDAAEGATCPPRTDGIPDDLRPGDRVIAAGRFSSYVPSSCNGTAESPQLLVNANCPLVREGSGEPPPAVSLSFEQADALALGTDASLLRHWSAGLVRIDNASAVPNEEGRGVVGPYGVIRLAETRLPVTNDIGYGDLSLAGPGDPGKSLDFANPTTFRSITGIVHLDYCAWSIAPRERCRDLDPASAGCP